ncbi:hypothetical protein UCDDS831_g03144 [Diplodia seriata]|uniref:Uncharacterized protein n=1 Tax=Diplodia seriata TaxID=420778 RepID=A0A0G2GIP3_9PEZI|nr:hypothetical protein UCDDS831_g03144 [Diplodia seriata]
MADAWAEQMLTAYPNSPADRDVVETLRSLLQRKILPQQAAESLTSAYDPLIRSGKTDTENLWGVYCAAIASLGHDVSSRGLLVSALLSISRLPDIVDDKGQPVMQNRQIFWRDVPDFAFWMSEGPAGMVSDREVVAKPERLRASRIAAAFGAEYLGELDREKHHAPRDGMRNLAFDHLMQALRWGFEDEEDVKRARLSAPQAATWILTAGPSLYQAVKERFSVGDYDGGSFDMERWNLWKGRFAELAAFERADAEPRRMAGLAVEEMQKIEKEA